MRPKGSGAAGASAALVLLDDVPHRLRRTALHLPLRRSERGLLYFYHGLLALYTVLPAKPADGLLSVRDYSDRVRADQSQVSIGSKF
jgi:hypothetical protein